MHEYAFRLQARRRLSRRRLKEIYKRAAQGFHLRMLHYIDLVFYPCQNTHVPAYNRRTAVSE
jgi:hypothetical protein